MIFIKQDAGRRSCEQSLQLPRHACPACPASPACPACPACPRLEAGEEEASVIRRTHVCPHPHMPEPGDHTHTGDTGPNTHTLDPERITHPGP